MCLPLLRIQQHKLSFGGETYQGTRSSLTHLTFKFFSSKRVILPLILHKYERILSGHITREGLSMSREIYASGKAKVISFLLRCFSQDVFLFCTKHPFHTICINVEFTIEKFIIDRWWRNWDETWSPLKFKSCVACRIWNPVFYRLILLCSFILKPISCSWSCIKRSNWRLNIW